MLAQLIRGERARVPTIEDCPGNVGGEEAEAKDPGEIRVVQLFPLSEVADPAVGALDQLVAQSGEPGRSA